jgi:sugar/nucleoside kinase (ribokinase family)
MKTILCYGAICADYELTVPRLPTAGTGVHVTAARWLAGGNALNEALALRSWGMRPQLWGDVLGTEAAGATVLAALQAADLTAAVQVAADAVTPICHVLVTPDGERTILALRAGTRALAPDDAALAAAEIVSVARYGLQTLEVITRARALNRLVVVGDVRTADDPAAQAADVIVTSAAELGPDAAARMAELQAVRGAAVVVSDGPRAVRLLTPDGVMLTQEPPQRDWRSTRGAGDRLRGALVRGLALGWDWAANLRAALRDVVPEDEGSQ